ncbi:hypothetical protein KGM_202764 [Danaus plexippus plexippus]|uniref:Uncharacterized protein n=1 Tax=Danaus plexippus plexippus TaxID=278856 RepID=A0A212F1Z8_DANPL|nr:hypothetical protein KGM_202764 [Danaus plexippus plexippus]
MNIPLNAVRERTGGEEGRGVGMTSRKNCIDTTESVPTAESLKVYCSGMSGESCAPRPPAPEPDQLYDHHSSEEELESALRRRNSQGIDVRGRLSRVDC